MTQAARLQEAELWQQHQLLELTIKIEPLRMDLFQPEKEKETLQPEQLPVKTEPLSDTEEESQQNHGSYNLRGSLKQTASEAGVASSGKSCPTESQPRKSGTHFDEEPVVNKQSQPRKSLRHSEKESTSTNMKEMLPRKSLRHSEKESVSTNIKEMLPRKSLRQSAKESLSTNVMESQPRRSLGHFEKESTPKNIKDSQPRKSLTCSAKESLVIILKESQLRESLGHSDEELPLINLKELRPMESDEETPLINLKESPPWKSREHSDEETPLINLKESQPRKSCVQSDEETPLVYLKESQIRKSSRHSDEETPLINLKELQPRKSRRQSDKETPLINLRESQPGTSHKHNDKETLLVNVKETQPRKSRRLNDEATPLINLKESQIRKSRRHSNKETPLINLKESQPQKSPQCLNKKSGFIRSTRQESIKEEIFRCFECAIEFKQHAEWAKHLIWHQKMIMSCVLYTCNKCGVQYSQLTGLKSHITSAHLASAISSQQSNRGQNSSYGDSCRQKSDEEIGRQNGEQQRNAEKVQQREDSDDEMDRWSEAGSDRMFEEDDRSVIEVGDQKRSEDVATVCPADNVEHIEENHQNTSEIEESNAKTTIADLKTQTHPQVTQETHELNLDVQETRRSSRMSSDAYIHKILHGDDQQRRFNRGRQFNRKAIVQDGQRKRQHEGQDAEANAGKICRRSEAVSGGFSCQSNVSTGQSGQQNSSGRNDQLDASRDIGRKSVEVENGQHGGQVGDESRVGDQEKDILQGDELHSRSSTLQGDSTSRISRRTVDGVEICYKETIYPCSECGLELTRPSQLARHKLRKHYQGPQECNVCGLQYDTLLHLQKHMRIDHDVSLPLENAVRDNEQGQTIDPRLNDKLYECNICGLRVDQVGTLQKHVLTHESVKSTPAKSYTCDVCDMVYYTPHALSRHMLFHESNGQPLPSRKREWFGKVDGNKIVIVDSEHYNGECKAQSRDGRSGQDGLMNDGEIKQETPCDGQDGLEHGGQSGKERDELNCGNEPAVGEHVVGKHGENQERFQGGIEIITPSVDELVKEITRRDGYISVCPTDVKFEDLVEKTPNTCSICGLRRNNPQQLASHMKMHALETRRRGTFLCDQCGAVYRCLGFLERHRLTHVVEKSRVHCVEEPKETSEDTVNGIPLSQIVTMSDNTQGTTSAEESTDKSATDKILIPYNTFYVCDECGKKFEQAKELLRHKLEHRRGNNPKPYVCQECGLRYSRPNLLEKHLITAHLNLRPELCNICGKRFHLKAHLLEHIRTHTGERPFKCGVCGKGFTTRRVNELHERLHTGLKSYKCEVCSKAFATNSTLYSHRVTHTGERRFPCTLCDKRFTASCALKKHLLVHSGEKPFSCEICSKAFSTNGNLQQHYVTHTKAKAFKCDQCNKGFAQAVSLNVHKRLHDGVKPYTCKVCQKSFASLGNCRAHEVLHSTERPFPCCACDKSFKSLPRLKAHVLVHSQTEAVEQHVCRAPEGGCVLLRCKTFLKNTKSHACTECGKLFNAPNKLRQHMVVHTGEKLYLCTLCGVGFTTSGSLKCHMRIHNGIKPYTCEVCGRQFTQAGNYYEHQSVHTGEKPFKCDICFQTFRLRHILRTHMLRHTGQVKRRQRRKKGPTKGPSKGPSKALKVGKTSMERKEQREESVEEEGIFPCLYVVEPQYDSDDSTGSEASDSEDGRGSEEQDSSDE